MVDQDKYKEVMAQIKSALSNNDVNTAEEIIEHEKSRFDAGWVEEGAFSVACSTDCLDYIRKHIDEIELNNGEDDCCSYLGLTQNEEVRQFLLDHGAMLSWFGFEGCSMAYETINNTYLSFEEPFWEKMWNRFFELTGLTQDDLEAYVMSEDTDEDDDAEPDSLPEPLDEFTLADICDMFNLYDQDEEFELTPPDWGDDVDDYLPDFLTALGFELHKDSDWQGSVIYVW